MTRVHPCFSTLPGEFIHKKKNCTFFPEIPRLVHPCYLGQMGAPVYFFRAIFDLSNKIALLILLRMFALKAKKKKAKN